MDALALRDAAIWDEVAGRHPEAGWCRNGPDLAGPLAA